MVVPDDLTSREPDEHRSLATGRLGQAESPRR